jgi:hypothetical protein
MAVLILHRGVGGSPAGPPNGLMYKLTLYFKTDGTLINFKATLMRILPEGYYIVGDAGYQLATNLLIPYPINIEMHPYELLSKERLEVSRIDSESLKLYRRSQKERHK